MAAIQTDFVQLSSEDGKIIRVLTSLLVDNSEYFRRAISNRKGREAITLDNTAANIKQMIQFLQHSKLQLTSVQNTIDMYKIGHIYEINGLKEFCRNRLIQMISYTNVCKIHDFACDMEDQLIRYHCWNQFYEHAEAILNTDDFLSCKEHTIWWLVYRPLYRNLTEVHLCNRLYAWAEKKDAELQRSKSKETKTKLPRRPLDARKYLDLDFVIKNIRFLTMQLEELEREVFPKKFLTEEEVKLIRSCLQNHDRTKLQGIICTNTTKRTEDQSNAFFTYETRTINNHPSQYINANTEFNSQFFVVEYCFLCSLKFPIKHRHERIETFVGILIWTQENNDPHFETMRLPINQDGSANVYPPLFIGKESLVIITTEPENVPDQNIYLMQDCDIYIEDSIAISYYLDVNLFF